MNKFMHNGFFIIIKAFNCRHWLGIWQPFHEPILFCWHWHDRSSIRRWSNKFGWSPLWLPKKQLDTNFEPDTRFSIFKEIIVLKFNIYRWLIIKSKDPIPRNHHLLKVSWIVSQSLEVLIAALHRWPELYTTSYFSSYDLPLRKQKSCIFCHSFDFPD